MFDSVNECCCASGPNIKLLVKDQSSSEEEDEDIVAENGRRKKSYQTGLNKRAKETTFSSNQRLKRVKVLTKAAFI